MPGRNGNIALARDYRKRYGKEIPTLTLAKLMYKDHPLKFNTVETARTLLRGIEGKMGNEKMKKSMLKHTDPTTIITEERPRNPYNIIEPESDDLLPFELQWDDFILAADFHVPNHRIEPIQCMIDYAKEHNIKKLFLNGDLLDNTPFTRWTREPVSGLDVKRWFDQAIGVLEGLKQHFDEIIWLEGNHDFWYTRWLMTKCELLFGDPYYSLTHRLQLDRLNIQYLDQKHLVKAGKLYISHGHIMLKGGGVHAAARLLTKSGVSHIISHVHRVQTFTKTDISGKIHAGYTTGCMCSLGMDYQPYGGDSSHGFAHITVKPNRDFKVRNYLIYNGEIQ